MQGFSAYILCQMHLVKKHVHSFWDIWVFLWVICSCDEFGWCNDIIVSSSCGPELLRQDPGAHIKTWWPIMTSGLWTSNTQIWRHFLLPLCFHVVTGVLCYAHTHTHTSEVERINFSQCHPRLTLSDGWRERGFLPSLFTAAGALLGASSALTEKYSSKRFSSYSI